MTFLERGAAILLEPMDARSQIERRAAQRFNLQVPVSFRLKDGLQEARGVTQDLSTAGTLLYTEDALQEGTRVELTFIMPSEITFDGNALVKCQGSVLRVVPLQAATSYSTAIHFEHFEFLDTPPIVHAVMQDRAEQEDLASSLNVFQPRGMTSFQ